MNLICMFLLFLEVLSLEITFKNPLSVSLIIDDVFPLWTFIPLSEDGSESPPISNEKDSNVSFICLVCIFVIFQG